MVTKYYHYLQKQDADCQTSLAPKPQPVRSPTPTAYQFKRDDGFIDWQIIKAAMTNLPLPTAQFTNHIKTAADYLMLKSAKRKLQLRFLSRATRALRGFPGVWTTVQTNKGQKRLKIHSLKINGNNIELQKVQLEGQDISLFNQIKNQVQ
jgi:hypothetical protein